MNKPRQLQCDLPESVAALFRGIGFDTNMYMNGCTETLFFHIGDGPGYQRFENATPEAVEEFCEYWRNQISVAKEYVANGCNPKVHEWLPSKVTALRNDFEDLTPEEFKKRLDDMTSEEVDAFNGTKKSFKQRFGLAVGELIRLRSVIEKAIADCQEYGMDVDDPILVYLREEGLGEDTGV